MSLSLFTGTAAPQLQRCPRISHSPWSTTVARTHFRSIFQQNLGARVIKVERPGVGDFARAYDSRVDGLASHFVWLNRSKESLALDLKNAEHMKVLVALLDKADVFVQNLAAGASARLGLSYEALKSKNPGLIVCDVSGYGDSGPYREKKSYDLLVQSEAGLLSVTGSESEVAKVGISIADISAGMYAYTNILAALMQRQKTGSGCRLDISMLESMMERTGASHATIYPYGPFETGGGDAVTLGVQNEREWTNFCQSVLEKPELSQDACFLSNSLLDTPKGRIPALIPPGIATATGARMGAVPALG
ncbi:hypothetical protein COCC4DRAFT_205616 [Bipolaris maydis ATCC 48331]|uniref:CoA-transferase family III domain-containing protein n=2 Tax=Cochliobolus heterostrophus TaxID=5016 RepID=M2USK5_COCH5|nr:uncharacterized protein COCC4DRAFT_205616 [Bipolaris maydis ATCC 48331]EMD96581.1 hypothetical protein COCHEDRAFT_1189602 [Bipolaris maydis C5]ENI00592.1 hypothetical protein COCC4DRAFT_205616 [Bipolaris maydis ATCC 48331]KAJ6273614.1 CoA-transferase family III domain-containing protein [Bipolaris maydis]